MRGVNSVAGSELERLGFQRVPNSHIYWKVVGGTELTIAQLRQNYTATKTYDYATHDLDCPDRNFVTDEEYCAFWEPLALSLRDDKLVKWRR